MTPEQGAPDTRAAAVVETPRKRRRRARAALSCVPAAARPLLGEGMAAGTHLATHLAGARGISREPGDVIGKHGLPRERHPRFPIA